MTHFVCGVRNWWVKVFIVVAAAAAVVLLILVLLFLYMTVQLPQHHLLKWLFFLYFLHWIVFALMFNINWTYMCGAISEIPFAFHWSIYLFSNTILALLLSFILSLEIKFFLKKMFFSKLFSLFLNLSDHSLSWQISHDTMCTDHAFSSSTGPDTAVVFYTMSKKNRFLGSFSGGLRWK